MQKHFTRVFFTAILATAGIAVTSAQAAPLGYTGGTISNDFNSLPTNTTNSSQVIPAHGPHEFVPTVTGAGAGMSGWQLSNPLGSSADTEFRSHDGSLSGNTGRGVISFGANGSNERALGLLPTSNQISTFGLVLLNNSLSTYTSFSLAYTGEQWRRGDIIGSPEKISFAYGLATNIAGSLTSVPALGFGSPNQQNSPLNVALNGNLPNNEVSVYGVVNGLNWGPGQQLVLRWSIAEQSGQDDALAIDNFSFNAVPEPSTLVLGSLALAGVAWVGMKRRSHHSRMRAAAEG